MTDTLTSTSITKIFGKSTTLNEFNLNCNAWLISKTTDGSAILIIENTKTSNFELIDKNAKGYFVLDIISSFDDIEPVLHMNGLEFS